MKYKYLKSNDVVFKLSKDRGVCRLPRYVYIKDNIYIVITESMVIIPGGDKKMFLAQVSIKDNNDGNITNISSKRLDYLVDSINLHIKDTLHPNE